MLPTPYVASLRIYEPIDSFEAKDQLRWSKISNTTPTLVDEQNISLSTMIRGDLSAFKTDGVHLLEIDGKKFIAPWSTTTRCWAALDDFKSLLPFSLIPFFIPQKLEESIKLSGEIIEDKVSHIITSTWSIPPRWFALFSPEDRLRGNNKDGAFTILRTTIANAKQRATFTHKSVLDAFGIGPIESEISDLIKWLEIFDAKSIVELDYGGLATYLNNLLLLNGEVGLDADTSVEDVASSIAGLASGDGALASRGYERLVSRWRKVAAMESAT
jgi:hypothetical protein